MARVSLMLFMLSAVSMLGNFACASRRLEQQQQPGSNMPCIDRMALTLNVKNVTNALIEAQQQAENLMRQGNTIGAACVLLGTLELINRTFPGTSYINKLCTVTVDADAQICHGTPGGTYASDSGLWEGGSNDTVENGLTMGTARSYLLLWAFDTIEYLDVDEATEYMLSSDHIENVLNRTNEVESKHGRWAFWLLFGATSQIAAVANSSSSSAGQNTASQLAAQLSALNSLQPEARMTALRSVIEPLVELSVANDSISPQIFTHNPPPVGPADKCHESGHSCNGNVLMQVLWATGGGLALALALASALILYLRMRKGRERNAVERGEFGAGGQAFSAGLEGGETTAGDRSQKTFEDPNVICTTVIMPDGQTAIAMGRRDTSQPVVSEGHDRSELEESVGSCPERTNGNWRDGGTIL